MSIFFLQQLEAVFGWILAASWQASILAALVLLLQWALGARLNPRWRYALWLLVLVRLVLPALPESALSLFQFAPPPPASFVAPVTEPLFVSAPLPAPSPSHDLPPIEPIYPFSFYSLLAVIWLAGAMALLFLTWQVNRRFARQIANSPEITDPELLNQFATAKAELGVSRSIRLIENSQVQSPAIMGLFHPTLLLPADVRSKFDARELRFIFLHELAHLKRGDVIAQALIALLQIVHWFNPVLWLAFRRMRIDREPATDALVLSRTGEDEKERYGLMLIKLLEHFNQRHSLPTLVGILEDKDQFKRRFSLIAKFTRGAYGWSLLGVLIIGVLAVACLTKAKAQEKSMPPPTANAQAKAGLPSKPPVTFKWTLVEIDEKTYEQNASEMNEAVRRGDVLFFLHNRPGVLLGGETNIELNVGQPGWFSIGEVRSYVASVSNEQHDGKASSVVQTKAVFLGLNVDFTWSKDGASLNSAWQVSEQIGNMPGAPQFHVTSFEDKDWAMDPGQPHGYWIGQTRGDVRLRAQGWLYETVKSRSPARLAVFMKAQATSPSTSKDDASASPKADTTAPATTSPGSESTPRLNDAAKSQGQTWLQVDYCETAEPNTTVTNGVLTNDQAHSKIFNPTNKIMAPKLVYVPLTIGTNAVSFQKPANMNWTVTVDWKDPHTTNAQAVTVNVKWPHANGGNVSYGFEFKAPLQPNTCFWVVGPWKGQANSNIFVHFVDPSSVQSPKATDAPAAKPTTDAGTAPKVDTTVPAQAGQRTAPGAPSPDLSVTTVTYSGGKIIRNASPSDKALQQVAIAREVARLKSSLELTPQQEAVVKAAMEGVAQSGDTHTPAPKTVDQALKEILSPQQEKTWEELKASEPRAQAESIAINETNSVATRLHLNAEQQKKVLSALEQVELDSLDKFKGVHSASELSTCLDNRALAQEMALAGILTTDQYAAYVESVRRDLLVQKVARNLVPTQFPPFQLAPPTKD